MLTITHLRITARSSRGTVLRVQCHDDFSCQYTAVHTISEGHDPSTILTDATCPADVDFDSQLADALMAQFPGLVMESMELIGG